MSDAMRWVQVSRCGRLRQYLWLNGALLSPEDFTDLSTIRDVPARFARERGNHHDVRLDDDIHNRSAADLGAGRGDRAGVPADVGVDHETRTVVHS